MRYTEEQIIGFLNPSEGIMQIQEPFRQGSFSDAIL